MVLELLDQLGPGDLIKVKLKNLAQLTLQQHWMAVRNRPGWEQSDFLNCVKGRTQKRNFVVARCRQDSPKDHPQGEEWATSESRSLRRFSRINRN